jgi:hypothetical protein
MNTIFNVDNQIDRVIDRQLDRTDMEFTAITKRSRVFVIPYTGPVYAPLPIVGLPNITLATTEVVQVSNYSLLNGTYTKGYDIDLGYYFIRDDGQYYFWWNSGLGGTQAVWQMESLSTYEIVAEVSQPNNGDIIPAEGWYIPGAVAQPIPLQITFLG